jgi:hypothetical protein
MNILRAAIGSLGARMPEIRQRALIVVLAFLAGTACPQLVVRHDASTVLIAGIVLLLAVLCAVGCALLGHEWRGFANHWKVEEMTLASVESEHPYLPTRRQVATAALVTLALPLTLWHTVVWAQAASVRTEPLSYTEQRSWQIANDAGNLTITGTVYSDTGATVPIASATILVSMNGGIASGTGTTDAGGQFSISGLTMTGGTVATLWIDGNATHKAVTVTMGSGSSMTGLTLIKDNLLVGPGQGISSAPPLTSRGFYLAKLSNSSDSDIASIISAATLSAGKYNVTVATGKRLALWNTGSLLNLSGSLTTSLLHLRYGTFGQSSGATINTAYTQSGGTFLSTKGYAMTVNGTFSQSAGAFTATSGTTTVTNAFNRTGGTFTHNSGTVDLSENNVSPTITTGGTTFYNLQFTSIGGNGGSTTLADSFTVANTLTITNATNLTHTWDASSTITITLQGNFSMSSSGNNPTFGSTNVTINMTGNNSSFSMAGGTFKANLNANGTGTISFSKTAGNNTAGTTTLNQDAQLFGNSTFYALTIASGKTLDVSNDGGTTNYNLTVSSTFTNSGVLTTRSGTVTLQNSAGGPVTYTTGGATFYNLNLNASQNSTTTVGDSFTVSNTFAVAKVGAGTISWTASSPVIITAQGNVSLTNGGFANTTTFGNSNVTLKLTGAAAQLFSLSNASVTFSPHVVVAKSSNVATLSGALTMNTSGQNLTLTGGTLDLHGNNLTVNKNLTIGTGTTLRQHGNETLSYNKLFVHKNSTIYYDSPGGTMALRNIPYANLVVGSTGSTVFTYPRQNLNLSGSLVLSGGTLKVTNGQNLTLSGSWTKTAAANAVFTSGTGTVTFIGSAAQTLTSGGTDANSDFATITINKSAGTLSLATSDLSGATLNVTGGTFSPGSLNTTLGALTVNGGIFTGGAGAVDLNGTLTLSSGTLTAPSGSFTVAGDWTKTGGTFTSGANTVTFDGAGTQTLTSGGTTSASAFNILTMNKASGMLALATNALSGAALNVSGGTFSPGSLALTTTALTVNGGTLTRGASSLTTQMLTVSSGTYDANGQTTTVPGLVTLNGGSYLASTATQTFNGGLWVNGGTFTGSSGNVSVTGNVTVDAGTLTAPSGTLSLTGNFTKQNAATFTASGGTVSLTGGNQTMTGSTTFYNLTKTVTSPTTLTLAATTTQTVQHTLTWSGLAANLLSIRSSITGVAAKIDPQGTRSVSYLDVKDNNNINATAIDCSGDQHCTNSGNNTNWAFPWTGTVYTDEGSTVIGAGKTVALSVNGGPATTGTTDNSGSFQIPKSTSNGDVVAIYLDGETEKAALVTRTVAGGLGDMDLYQNRLILHHETSSALTTAHLATADDIGDTDLTDFYIVTGNDLTVSSTKELFIRAGSTFSPGGNLAVTDIDVNGILRMGSNVLTVSGTFDASGGGAIATTGTSTFDTTFHKTLSTGSGVFKHVSITTSGAVLTLSGGLVTSGILTLETGSTLKLAGYGLTNTNGSFQNRGTLALQGGETLTGFGNDLDSGRTRFEGASSYTGLSGLTRFHELAFSGAGLWTLAAPITASGVTLTAGTLDVSSSNFGILDRGSWTDTGNGTFVERRGAVTFAGTGTINTNEAFSGVVLNARGATVTLASTLPVSGSLTISGGTLAVSGTNSINLSGSWLKKPLASFQSGSGTVRLDGTNQVLSGSTIFWHLRKSVTSADTLAFAAGTTQTVRGTWTAEGTASNVLSLRSTQNGRSWQIDPQGTRTLSFVDVQDSTNTNATPVICSNDCVNSGRNINWAFPLTVTAYSDSGSTLIGAGKTVAIAVNGGSTTTAVTNSQSVASFTTVSASAGDVLTMWLEGESEDGVTVTVTNGTTLAFSLYKDYLIVEHEYGSAITNAHLAVADDVNDTDVSAVYTMSGTTLVMADGKTFLIKSGSTYAPGGSVMVNDIRIAGTFTMGTENVTVDGSWNASGGSFTGSNAVTFTSDDPEIITSNGSTFQNVVFEVEGENAEWVTTDEFTVNGSQVVHTADGSSDTTPPTISDIEASVTTNTSAVITWTTNESATSKVLYGTSSGALTSSSSRATLNLDHTIILRTLTADTGYFYRVVSTDLAGNTATGALLAFSTTNLSVPSSSGGGSSTQGAAETATKGGGGGGRSRDACSQQKAATFADLTAEPQDDGTVTVRWTSSTDTVPIIRYGVESPSEWAIVNLDGFAQDHALTIPAVQAGKTYRLQAAGIDKCGTISASDEATFSSDKGKLWLQDPLTGTGAAELSQPEQKALLDQVTKQYIAFLKTSTNKVLLEDLKKAIEVQQEVVDALVKRIPGPQLAGAPKVEVTDTTAVIRWSTDEDANALVSYAPDKGFQEGSYAQTVGDPATYEADHAVGIIGMSPGTRYHYKVQSATAIGAESESPDFTFLTGQQAVTILNYAEDILTPDSVRFRWQTNAPTSTELTVTPYRNGSLQPDSSRAFHGDSAALKHEITASIFEPGVLYDIELWGKTEAGVIVSKTLARFSTSADSVPPEIQNVQTNAAISPGKESKIQAVITWSTNHDSTSRVFYERGVNSDPSKPFASSTEPDHNYTRNHIVVLPALEPGEIYSFHVESMDSNNASSRSQVFTLLTPQQEAGIFQVILKQMEGEFGWMGQLRR